MVYFDLLHKTLNYCLAIDRDRAHVVGLLQTSDEKLRALSDNKQHSQETDIHALGGIQYPNPSNRTDADPRLRQPDHRDRLLNYTVFPSGDSQHIVVTGVT
jgi:hypothetical protein